MTRSLRMRGLALVVGLVACLATPGVALAHGYAHHEAHEHATPSALGLGELSSPQHEHGHAHNSAGGGISARSTSLQPAIVTNLTIACETVVTVTRSRVLPAGCQAPPHSGEPPPLHTRAPPAAL